MRRVSTVRTLGVLAIGLMAALSARPAFAEDGGKGADPSFNGTYVMPLGKSEARLTLNQGKDGAVSGEINGPTGRIVFTGRIRDGRVVGMLSGGGANVTFNVVPQPGKMIFRYLQMDSDGKPRTDTMKELVFFAPASGAGEGMNRAADKRGVRVNGVEIPDAEMAALERKYHQRIPPGDYWYDKRCGAWGMQGGPTLGLTVAGINIGGPMRRDASNGHTGVIVNGRELHLIDVLSLERAGIQAVRGKWWVNANGDFGLEGNPFPLGNLVRIANQTSGKRYGSTYSEAAGGSVASDGQGGFISSFRDGHGGYIGHYTGE